MKISQIYQQYPIPDNLSLHMYRVSAVSQVIFNNFSNKSCLDLKTIITTCLLHDAGNLIKYDMSNNLLSKSEINEWTQKQIEMINKYGNNEHIATIEIARQIGASEYVLKLLSQIGSSKLFETVKSDDWNRKICSYSDMRVTPLGISSLNERFAEAHKRYRLNSKYTDLEVRKSYAITLEQQLQMQITKFDLNQITNELVQPIIETLPEFQI